MRGILLAAILFSGIHSFAKPILLDEGRPGTVFGSESTSISDLDASSFENALSMRSKKRMGIGGVVLGPVGLAAVMIELNFTAQNSGVLQYGGGPKYNSIGFQWKHIFGGEVFTPYLSMGLSRWYNANGDSGSIGSTQPALLGEKYLTEQEKASGRFAKTFMTPAFGLQYHQLRGKYIGMSFIAEVVLLMELSKLTPTPTGSLGLIYYF